MLTLTNNKKNIHKKITKNPLNKHKLLLQILALKIYTISNLHQNLIYNHFGNQIFKFIQNNLINNIKNPTDNHNTNKRIVINLKVSMRKLI